MLTPIRGIPPEPLVWEQPSWTRREYALRMGREVVATLRWPGIFGFTAEGETAEGRYRIRMPNLFSDRAVIHAGDSDSEVAVWEPRWHRGGTVRFPGGRTFRIRRGDFFGRRLYLEDEAGAVLSILHSRRLFLRQGAQVEVQPGAERVRELPLLLIIAWYARLRMHHHHGR